ncbi:MAG: urease accessory protein UreF, partial [Candidatus Poribacteria bacterium]|nr:urease accessory protein UreF [Candidatus Poribacteria bacterium]
MSLLHLLQMTDSAFPTGSFAHSFGLETYVQRGIVHDRASFEAFLRSSLANGLMRSDATAVSISHRATVRDDFMSLRQVDSTLSAMKVAEESRVASAQIGKQFLRNVGALVE